MSETPMGLVRNNQVPRMNAADMPWWEREKLLTPKDQEAIMRAIYADYADIDESWAETEAGKYELRNIISRKYHDEEFRAGIL